ncbi:MAG TPA: hypothetical protein VGK20_16785 [Candidatus Binatia bacterium]|jgi:hypothetical protein
MAGSQQYEASGFPFGLGTGPGEQGRWSGPDDGGPSFSTLFAPVYPWNRWSYLSPLVSVAGAATIFVMSGVAVASLLVMSFALLVVVFLLVEVFGFEIDLPPMPFAPR